MATLHPYSQPARGRAGQRSAVVKTMSLVAVLLTTLLSAGCSLSMVEFALKHAGELSALASTGAAAIKDASGQSDTSTGTQSYAYDPQSLDVPSLEAKAREGNAEAAWQLYAFVDLPEADAWKWLCLAANGKYAEAQNELGRLYWYGVDPVKEDRVRGYMWYKLAARRSKSAAHEVKQLQHELTPEQLAEAERLVAAWKPAPESCQVRAQQKT